MGAGLTDDGVAVARRHPVLLGIAGATLVAAVWAVLVVTGIVPERSLPAPWSVAAAMPVVLADPRFLLGAGDTLATWVGALALASLAGVAAGLLLGAVRPLRRPAMVLVDAVRSVPATALIPVAILVFGLGPAMKGAVAVLAALPIVLIATITGVAGVEPQRRDAARAMRWSLARRALLLVLPSAAPSIVSGVRVAASIALVVVVSAEILGARSGVGIVLVQYQQALRIDAAYALVTVVGAVGMLLAGGLASLERRAVERIRLV